MNQIASVIITFCKTIFNIYEVVRSSSYFYVWLDLKGVLAVHKDIDHLHLLHRYNNNKEKFIWLMLLSVPYGDDVNARSRY